MPPEDNHQIRRTRSLGNIRRAPINVEQNENQQNVQQRVSIHGNEQGNQRRLASPLQVRPVTVDLNAVVLEQPNIAGLQAAYNTTGFELADSGRKRKKLLDESTERFRLQERLRNKVQTNAAPQQHTEINVKKAMKLSDEKLVRDYGRYLGEAEQYLTVRYNLMKNKYYALLPVEEMRKMDRLSLLAKLRDEYGKEQRDPDLIRLYEDLIRLKIHEEAQDETKKDRPNPENPPLQISRKEREHNRKALEANISRIDNLHINDNEKAQRRLNMQRVMDPQGEYKLWAEEIRARITPAQYEGIRSILAWMYRNCNKSSESKESLVYRLTKARPEQLLLTFYIIENKMQYAPNPECFYKAITGYIPDLNTFKDRMIASKAKVWKRVGSDRSDSVIYWSKLGMAARFAMNCDLVTDYCEFTSASDRLQEQISNTEDPVQKLNLIQDMLIQKGNLLLTLYRAGGLAPDMPADLIEEPSLRTKVETTIGEFTHWLEQLGEFDRMAGGRNYDRGARKKKPSQKGIQDPSVVQGAGTTIDNAKSYIGGALSFTNLASFMGKKVTDVTGSDTFKISIRGVGSVCSIVGLISSIISAFKLGKGSNLTLADHASQGLSVASGIVGNFTSLGTGGAEILDKSKLINLGRVPPDPTLPWYGNTTVKTFKESFSTLGGKIDFISGGVSVVTGTAVAASGFIDIRRGVSSRKDVVNARAAINREAEQNAEQGIVLTEKQQRERERLKRLLDHQDRAISDQEFSGTIKMIGGGLTAVGGALTMSGILAPIGGVLSIAGSVLNIGLGLLYARHRRNLTQKQAVDDAIRLEELVDMVQQDQGLNILSKKEREKLRKEVRMEALGSLGYATYKEAFSEISKDNAKLLYEKVFTLPENTEEYRMYFETLKSMGFKIRKAGNGQKENIPTEVMIYSKLMS
ncbi:MAG: hypothetical protein IJP84_00260 [Lachnospiraceae bacterium]|nr:hypothetical protein [Lachnospiraceae bacterium]